MKPSAKLLAIAVIWLSVGFLPNAATAGDTSRMTCFRDWSIASDIVQRERLLTVTTLSDTVRRSMNALVVRALLCERDGVYVYRVVMKDADGRLRTATVDAKRRSGQPQIVTGRAATH